MLKPWQLSQKAVFRAKASHETDLSSKLRSLRGATPIFGFVYCCRIPWPAQLGAECSALMLDAIGCVAGAVLSQTGCSVSVICKRCETKADQLRRSCASKRSRCGAVRACLELGKPSSEMVGVKALTARVRLEPSVEIVRVEELSQRRRAFVLLVVNPQRRSCVSKRPKVEGRGREEWASLHPIISILFPKHRK